VAKAGDRLEIPDLGIRIELRRTGEDTAGELLEIDVIGRPRGFITQEHVHTAQRERHEVVAGGLKLVLAGREHVLRSGETMEVPAGTPHRQLPADEPTGHVRIEVRPAGSTQAFLERLAELSRDGRFNRFGYPKPVAGAQLVRDFGEEGHATRPPLPVQRALADAVLRVAAVAREARREYLFVDEWDVAAPIEAVHAALADARTYPEWWRPVYLGVEAAGPPAVGQESRQHFKGRLPYHLRTRSRIVRLEPPQLVEADVDGDLRGRGLWTLTPAAGGTHVRFDWRVHADRKLLRVLTPLLRPLFRWNHDWAIARAQEGLEPYARRSAAERGQGAGASA
jgi:uncharacterized protein YndB with AHSA1/START domain/mannose-6-phosphate isomerase-like protein (cupin superfamily)